jgi:hypothetical protein
MVLFVGLALIGMFYWRDIRATPSVLARAPRVAALLRSTLLLALLLLRPCWNGLAEKTSIIFTSCAVHRQCVRELHAAAA